MLLEKVKKSILRFTIANASFKEDHDGLFKQDPYIEVHYLDQNYFTTSVKENAGKFATWNEKFDLDLAHVKRHPHETIQFMAYDLDLIGSDFLGQTVGIRPYNLFNITKKEPVAERWYNLYGKT